MVKVGAEICSGIVVVAFSNPLVPVTVNVYCPTAAELLAVSKSELLSVVGFGLQEAVTPTGKPDSARFTLPVNPYSGFTKIPDVVEEPGARENIVVCPWSVKDGARTCTGNVTVWVREPLVPVMVAFVVPSAVVLLAVSIRLLFPVVGFGLKDAVTPLGRPDTASFTLPVNPFSGFTPTLSMTDVPCPMIKFELSEIVKSCASTSNMKVVADFWEPLVPEMVTAYCPFLAELAAVSVSVLVVVVGFRLHAAVTPLGRPDAARSTLPVKPYAALTVTVDVVELPWPTLTVPAVAREKAGA
jgi:hypothetical protein